MLLNIRNKKIVLILLLLLINGIVLAQKKSLTVQDIMKFKEIHNAAISEDGKLVVYTASPDRGDGVVVVKRLSSGREFTIERGSKPVFSADGAWVAAALLPEASLSLNVKKGKDKPVNGLVLLNTVTGDTIQIKNAGYGVFSADSRWLAVDLKNREKFKGKKIDKKAGSPLLFINLKTMKRRRIDFVTEFAFDSSAADLAYARRDTLGSGNGIFTVQLKKVDQPVREIQKNENMSFFGLTWDHKRQKLAYFATELDAEYKPGNTTVHIWEAKKQGEFEAVKHDAGPKDRVVYHRNQLRWSGDGKRLFFGLKLITGQIPEKTKIDSIGVLDIEGILSKREVDVWHWNDDYINPQQKKMWKSTKHKTYQAVYHLQSKKVVCLADSFVPDVTIPDNSVYALGISNVNYRKQMTWYGHLADVYLINLQNGLKTKVIDHLEGQASLSPNGKYVIYYKEKHWFLYNCKKGTTRNLTAGIANPFYNEDHDYPSSVPGYGTAGWTDKDRQVLIYDKYDIWKFSTKTGAAINITGRMGRENHRTFRIIRQDRKKKTFKADADLLLSSYHNLRKDYGFYRCNIAEAKVYKLIEAKKKFRFLAKAEKSDCLLYTRESYTEFPDLRVANSDFTITKKISEINPQIKDFAWGEAELVEWQSGDGIPLQGVLIKPGNYEKGKKYPVIVYYYRSFSQRLHEFNQMVINHRPNFPFYASNGYAVFLPDVKFEVGLPGASAVKCLVPGLQKLIDMGIADKNGIALHGHSWSGYQTAFVITRTNMFACAVAGAPVSNMTSAYSGIRWGSGMARQFQYEQSQSRIGGSLWEKRDLYIENSPVFFADRIQTPLLIMFGDEDGAVPWYQGIELYLALRRFEKDCVFLQYRGEPHHLKKYANKLDYTIKMMEYLDHYCKGKPAPNWLSEGVPYQGH